MKNQLNNGRSWLRAVGIGLGVSVLTGLIMMALTRAGFSPFPKPPSLAFVEVVAGRALPLPVGLLFHTAYVTLWSVVFIHFIPKRTIKSALLFAAALWLVILFVFFPISGWGIAGLAVSPRLIPASLLSHLLFGLFLWALDTVIPSPTLIKVQTRTRA